MMVNQVIGSISLRDYSLATTETMMVILSVPMIPSVPTIPRLMHRVVPNGLSAGVSRDMTGNRSKANFLTAGTLTEPPPKCDGTTLSMPREALSERSSECLL